jgi:hypothetical protein
VSIKSSCDARHVVPRPEPRVFLKSVEEQFVAATADGKKFFECSKGKHMFKKLFAMSAQFTDWCHRLTSWRNSNDGQLPGRNSADPEEASVANWIGKTKLRCRGPLTTSRPATPSQQQLTAAELHQFAQALSVAVTSLNAGVIEDVCGSPISSLDLHGDDLVSLSSDKHRLSDTGRPCKRRLVANSSSSD